MINKIVLFVIHMSKPAPITYKNGEENTKIESYQNYVYQFRYNGNVPAEPMKVACGTRHCCATINLWETVLNEHVDL
jgi:hypothetical protein